MRADRFVRTIGYRPAIHCFRSVPVDRETGAQPNGNTIHDDKRKSEAARCTTQRSNRRESSIRFKERRVAVVMAMLIHGTSFVG